MIRSRRYAAFAAAMLVSTACAPAKREPEPAKPVVKHYTLADTPVAPPRKKFSFKDTPTAPVLKGGRATPTPVVTPEAVAELPMEEPAEPKTKHSRVVVIGDGAPPTPVYTPDPRPKEGAIANVVAWRARPYRIPVGRWPKAVRFAKDGIRAYVTNFDSQSVSVIDVASQQVIKTVDLGDNAVEEDFSADGKTLYVSGWLHEGLYFLDLETFTSEKVGVGVKPKGVAVTPDGKSIYVANWASDSVSVVDVATRAVTAEIPVGSIPRWVSISKDGKTALVTNFRGRTVSVLDLEKNVEVAKILGIKNPRHIVLTPDGKMALVTDREAGKLHGVDLATRKIKWTTSVGERPKTVDVTKDGKFALTANYGSHDVGLVRLSDHKLLARIPAGAAPSGLEISPDGKTVYVTDWYDYDVEVIDLAYPGSAQETLPEEDPEAPLPVGAVRAPSADFPPVEKIARHPHKPDTAKAEPAAGGPPT